VLIPRPETEILVERALEILHASGTTEPHVLDIGTGSGNIALTVASKAPGARVTAIDVSEEALQVAATNAQLLRVEHVEFVQTDIRDTPLAGRAFDLILANPPYVSRDEYEHLPPELRDHEPREALTDEGDGRLLLDRILSFSPERLLPEGTLLMEMGAGQSDWCLARAAECGFTEARVHADHAGIPRILEARRGDAGGSER
jgi:release factor glutamine methyltransferase